VKQAEEYMRAHLEASISLMSLCQPLYTSERPLTYGFREVYGSNPMAYLKTLRRRQRRRRSQKLPNGLDFGAWGILAGITKRCLVSYLRKR
jgi:AraC-like DNA-binding protein